MSTQLAPLLSSLLQTPGDESTLAAVQSWVQEQTAGDHGDALARAEAAAAELGKAGRWGEAVGLLNGFPGLDRRFLIYEMNAERSSPPLRRR